ncbi:MAG TPA: hypothetical protein ENJ82_15280 [Bacteroidetes bacterium]|nr:hypothetical protein [Bacteroidota bacterium]
MHRIYRIAAFTSVSFVLFFMAKISKVDLYTAYFKTITDVEIRNSQDVTLSGVYLDTDYSLEAQPSQVLPEMTITGPALHATNWASPNIPLQLTSHYLRSHFYSGNFHFFAAAAPRAPTA